MDNALSRCFVAETHLEDAPTFLDLHRSSAATSQLLPHAHHPSNFQELNAFLGDSRNDQYSTRYMWVAMMELLNPVSANVLTGQQINLPAEFMEPPSSDPTDARSHCVTPWNWTLLLRLAVLLLFPRP
jgi:hypothetical protein